jgi:hypothetical protein
MRITRSSTVYVLLTLTLISLVIGGIIAGCDKKHIDPPVVGPSGGSGPVGGGDTQKIQLLANPSDNITVFTGEQATAKITAIVKNSIGQPMPDGTVVYWTATAGALDSTSTTASNGSATVTLTFPKSYNGCSWITAKSGDAQATIEICVTTQSKPFSVETNNATVSHFPPNNKATITVIASTADEGLQVTFTVVGGGSLNRSGGTIDATGKLTATFTGFNPTAATTVSATITATTADGRSGSVTIYVTNP